MGKVIDIREKYRHELTEIENNLNQLKEITVYDRHGEKLDFLPRQADHLSRKIDRLIDKIEYGKRSAEDTVIEAIRR